MKVVFDSSSLVLLAKTSMLGIATKNFECVITKEVKKEILQKKDLQDAKMLANRLKEGGIKVEGIRPVKDLEYEFRLGKGEASALALALHEKSVIATDDKAAIRACKVFDVEFVTAIDFVLRAFEKGKITAEEARTKIMKLDKYGRYDTKIIKMALEKVGDRDE